ncbi:MAG: hypothetical protein OJF49_002815 [Ktedonobacterales bacterium]|jgi:hypothetical protein|nr:MAG: hypothetical protein OJF49_002815 [Ktedonobacterales bacterium]
MDAGELVQRRREQRLITLSLADQVPEERWREPALAGERTIHDLLAHVLAWDEWAIAVFEISASRDLPPVLFQASQDVDAYNERAVARFRALSRDDIISGLQTAGERALSSAHVGGGADWELRRIAGLRLPNVQAPAPGAQLTEAQKHGPSVRAILRILMIHEAEHDQEIMTTYGVQPNLERFQEGAESDADR